MQAPQFCDICLWNNNLIFVEESRRNPKFEFELIDIDKKTIIKKFRKDGGDGIKCIKHPEYGDYLVSKSLKGELNLYKISD